MRNLEVNNLTVVTSATGPFPVGPVGPVSPLRNMIVYDNPVNQINTLLPLPTPVIFPIILLQSNIIYNTVTGILTCNLSGYYRITSSWNFYSSIPGYYNIFWGLDIGGGNFTSIYNVQGWAEIGPNLTTTSNSFVTFLTTGSDYAFCMDASAGPFGIQGGSKYSQWEIEFISSS